MVLDLDKLLYRNSKELTSFLCRIQFTAPLEIKRFRHSHGILGQPVTVSLLAVPRHVYKQGCKEMQMKEYFCLWHWCN